MFISRIKAKGNVYFYAYVYDNSSLNGMRTVYSLGRKEKALVKINAWKNRKEIPVELVNLGLNVEKIDKWRERIEREEII